VFVETQRTLRDDLQLTVGTKVEYNPYTQLELLPNVRLAWAYSPQTTFWGALSRSVRAPSRLDVNLFAPKNPPYLLAGGPNFQSEIAQTAEVGMRTSAIPNLNWSATAFVTRYSGIRSLDQQPSGQYLIGNAISGTVSGVETWASYQWSPQLAFDAALTLQHEQFTGASLALAPPGSDPSVTWRLGSRWNPQPNLTCDLTVRHVSPLSFSTISAYTALDASVGWRLRPNVELSLIGRNLFDPGHPEFAAGANTIEVQRSVDVRLKVTF